MTLGPDGLHLEDPGSITTATGKRVNPLDLHVEDIAIEDIARALSRQCRYNGHVGGFLSVARHSIWVARAVDGSIQLEALLHDAAEAYLGDLVRPLKHSAFGREYLLAEERADAVIADKFRLRTDEATKMLVKGADNDVLINTELASARHSWDGSPDEDEVEFLEAFNILTGRRPRTIIGLAGRKQHGKDTAALALLDQGFQRYAFADKMRAALLALDPLVPVRYDGVEALSTLVTLEGWDEAKQNHEVRRLLQKFGTEAGRAIHGENCWVDALMNDMSEYHDVVITDVRFPNEAEAIKAAGGEVWRIYRPNMPAPEDEHISETALDRYDFDCVIDNDSTVEVLHTQVLKNLDRVGLVAR